MLIIVLSNKKINDTNTFVYDKKNQMTILTTNLRIKV
jgi:hypothetical protein